MTCLLSTLTRTLRMVRAMQIRAQLHFRPQFKLRWRRYLEAASDDDASGNDHALTLLADAIEHRASDLRIDPAGFNYRICMRVDRVLCSEPERSTPLSNERAT